MTVFDHSKLREDPASGSLKITVSFEGFGTGVSNVGVEATGAVETSTVTESGTVKTGAVVSVRAAWWRAARRRFLSLSAGPR